MYSKNSLWDNQSEGQVMGKAIGIDLGTTNSVAAFNWANMEVVTADDNTPPDRKLTRSRFCLRTRKTFSRRESIQPVKS